MTLSPNDLPNANAPRQKSNARWMGLLQRPHIFDLVCAVCDPLTFARDLCVTFAWPCVMWPCAWPLYDLTWPHVTCVTSCDLCDPMWPVWPHVTCVTSLWPAESQRCNRVWVSEWEIPARKREWEWKMLSKNWAMLLINVKIRGNLCVTAMVVVFLQMLMPKHLFGVLNSLPK